MMADPARIKSEESPAKIASAINEEHPVKTEQPENVTDPETSAEENKESNTQDQPKAAPVSSFYFNSKCSKRRLVVYL